MTGPDDREGVLGCRLVGTAVSAGGHVLGRVSDLVLDKRVDRLLGFDVLCLDGRRRFLPWGACRVARNAVDVASPLSLLGGDESDFYRLHGVSLEELRRAGPTRRLRRVELDEGGRVVLVGLEAQGFGGRANGVPRDDLDQRRRMRRGEGK